MSCLHNRKWSRWSDPVLRKHSFCQLPISGEEPTLLQSPPLFSLTQHCLPLNETLTEYCLHEKHTTKKFLNAPPESQDDKKLKSLKSREARKIQENLDLYLTGIQVEEALLEDKHTALMQHLNLSTVALEALIQYGQSLRISELAACRMLNVSHLLTLPQPYLINFNSDSRHLVVQLQQLEERKENKLIVIQDLINHCSRYIAYSEKLNELMHDHYTKKEKFYIATQNFRNFLSNLKLSILQMEKLRQQHNVILNNYQQSRYMLSLELSKIINMRLAVLQEGFTKVQKFRYNDDDANEFLIFLKLIGEKLCPNDPNTAEAFHDQHLPKSQLCEKCKINHINES